jgi:hypothetical protein
VLGLAASDLLFALTGDLGLDLADAAHRARIIKLLATWIASGALRVEERKDRNRQMKKFVVVGRAVDDHSATPSGGVASHTVAVEQQSATLHPAPYRGGGIADAATPSAKVGQKAGVAPARRVIFPAGNPAFRPILAEGESIDDPIPGWPDDQ